jgi:arylsulfatase A-like enzyme
LIIHFPSQNIGAKKVYTRVETVDIMPTLLQILGFPLPSEIQGKSLLPLILDNNSKQERFAYSESYYPRYHYGWSELKSIQNSRYKYIQAPRPELYDIVNDPNELTNIYRQENRIGKQFEEKLNSLLEEMSAEGIEEKGPQKLDEEAMEKLMALGYVGGFQTRKIKSISLTK